MATGPPIYMSMWYILSSVYVLCVNRSPGWSIWLNYEVVSSQASVRYWYILRLCCLLLTTFIYPLPPHLYQLFLDISIFPPTHTAPLSAAICNCNTYLYTCSPSPLPARSVAHLNVAHARHISASAAHLCAPGRMPASATVSCFRLPPFF